MKTLNDMMVERIEKEMAENSFISNSDYCEDTPLQWAKEIVKANINADKYDDETDLDVDVEEYSQELYEFAIEYLDRFNCYSYQLKNGDSFVYYTTKEFEDARELEMFFMPEYFENCTHSEM